MVDVVVSDSLFLTAYYAFSSLIATILRFL